MTTKQRKKAPPSISALWAVVDRVAPRDEGAWGERPALRRGRRVSVSRAGQLRSTVRQLERAVEHGGVPRGSRGRVEVLLSPRGVDAVLELARDGALRDPRQKPLVGRPLPDASLGVLRDCLGILAEEAGVETVLPRVWRALPRDLSPAVSRGQAAAMYRRLADLAASAPLDARLARTLACVAVVLDSGMRRGDMLARTVADVDVDGGLLRVSHHAQNGTVPTVESVVELRAGTVVALRRWLEHRSRLVGALEGGDPGALWVTVEPIGRRVPEGRDALYPAGMPLGPRGYSLGFADGVERLNLMLAGRWEGPGPWEPLPRRPEQLRRAVWEEALRPWSRLSDAEWAVVRGVFPPPGGGVPSQRRRVVDAIRWRFESGGPWFRLPDELGSDVVARRVLRWWVEDGTWERAVEALEGVAGGRVVWARDAGASLDR